MRDKQTILCEFMQLVHCLISEKEDKEEEREAYSFVACNWFTIKSSGANLTRNIYLERVFE